ncbi:unnamed protein product [Closterium sp. NIES-65]|nr:unnamed protein product [Closterium sp. NIES-65]
MQDTRIFVGGYAGGEPWGAVLRRLKTGGSCAASPRLTGGEPWAKVTPYIYVELIQHKQINIPFPPLSPPALTLLLRSTIEHERIKTPPSHLPLPLHSPPPTPSSPSPLLLLPLPPRSTMVKELRSGADRLGTLQSRREAAAVVRGKDVLQKLFYDLSERYKGHRKSIRLLHMDRPDELRRIRPLINSPQEKLSSRVLSLPVCLSLSASSHLPLSASSHLPLSASSHLPLSASSHLPLSASSHLPLSASSHLPLSASSHLPLSVSSHLPLSVSSHLPLSVSSYACLHASAGTSINPMSFTAAAPLQSLHLPPSPRPPRYIDRPDELRRSRPPSIPPPPSEPRPPGCSLPSEDTAFTPPPPPPPPPLSPSLLLPPSLCVTLSSMPHHQVH